MQNSFIVGELYKFRHAVDAQLLGGGKGRLPADTTILITGTELSNDRRLDCLFVAEGSAFRMSYFTLNEITDRI